ncbi:MAG: hypothetical protein WC693_03570 [Patescibacteria group bacterium]
MCLVIRREDCHCHKQNAVPIATTMTKKCNNATKALDSDLQKKAIIPRAKMVPSPIQKSRSYILAFICSLPYQVKSHGLY